MSSVLMMLAFLTGGVLVSALGVWLMIRRWPLQVEDLLGYFGLLAPDESITAQSPETPSSRQRRRGRGGRGTPAPPTFEPDDSAPR